MQLLSALQGSFAPGQKCTNKQVTTARRRRLKGLALALSGYATSLRCPLSNPVVQFPVLSGCTGEEPRQVGRGTVSTLTDNASASSKTFSSRVKLSSLSLQSHSVVSSQAHSGFYWFGAADPQAGSLGSIFSERS